MMVLGGERFWMTLAVAFRDAADKAGRPLNDLIALRRIRTTA